ncbi:hypothetical protein D3C80_1247500 [compost metagenome]
MGADDQLRQGVEVVGDDFHAAFAAVLAHEPFLDAWRAIAPEGDADMPQFKVALQRQALADAVVFGAHHAHVLFVEQEL